MTFVLPNPAFATLEKTRLDLLSGAQWDEYFATMLPWLQGPNAYTRSRTVSRLCMAIFSAERRSVAQAREAGSALPYRGEERVEWLLAAVEQAHARFDDVIPAFLKALARLGLDEPYHTPLLAWLHRIHDAPPPNVRRDVVEGTMLLRENLDEHRASDVSRFVGLLDHPSNYMRACAARQLSCVNSPFLTSAEAFALIKEKELLRPGIAGPFWTDWHFMREYVPVDPVVWMLDILENRDGPEPIDMQFTGIDFYLHEICGSSPEIVRRMITGGYVNLAVDTATETLGMVPGMEAVLRELADDPDEGVHIQAQKHLAHYYGVLHPGAAGGSITRHPDWSDACDTFSFHWGEEHRLWLVVLYPPESYASFDDGTAWSLIDRLLPPGLRGDLVGNPVLDDDARPEPLVLGGEVLRSYASGARVCLAGDVTSKAWSRIDIVGHRLGKNWAPFGP